VHHLVSGEVINVLGPIAPDVRCIIAMPDGPEVAVGSGNRLRVLDLLEAVERQTMIGHIGWINSVDVSPDGKFLVSASEDATLRIWDALTGEEIAVFIGDNALTACLIASDGKTIVAGEESGRVHFLRFEGIA
jgi:WD40 repeat protein